MTSSSSLYPKLVADLGGTNIRFAICHGLGDASHEEIILHDIQQFSLRDYQGLKHLITYYLSQCSAVDGIEQIQSCCFAVAGPMLDGVVKMTNYSWEISAEKLNEILGNQTLGSQLIKPTKIYTDILKIKSFKKIKAIANITGGGLTENIPRVLPENKSAELDFNKINMGKLFSHVQKKGNIDNKEMLKVFNCGIGIVLIVNKKDSEKIIHELKKIKLISFMIGKIINKTEKKSVVYLNI